MKGWGCNYYSKPNRKTNIETRRTITSQAKLTSTRLTEVEIYKQAYEILRKNQGEDEEKIDGMNLSMLEKIAKEMGD